MTNAITGSQAIFRATSFNIHAANKSIPRNAAASIQAVCIDIVPDGRCLEEVLGLEESISLSIILFKAIAKPLSFYSRSIYLGKRLLTSLPLFTFTLAKSGNSIKVDQLSILFLRFELWTSKQVKDHICHRVWEHFPL